MVCIINYPGGWPCRTPPMNVVGVVREGHLWNKTGWGVTLNNPHHIHRWGRYEKKSQIKITSRSTLGYVSRQAYSSVTLYNNFTEITVEVLNKLLANQQVSITQSELEQLIKIPGVKFDLPLNDQTYPSFEGLVGKPKTRGWKAGVYIFTHLPTGGKYVGSSNSLSRRLDQYFTPHHHLNQEDSGLLLPLIRKEGFDQFSLEIFVMPRGCRRLPPPESLDTIIIYI